MAVDPSRSAPSDVPTAHQLRAALTAGRSFLPAGRPTDAINTGYARLSTDGVYSVDDLRIGDAILRRASVLKDVGRMTLVHEKLAQILELPEAVACNELLSLYLEAEPPLWLTAAVTGDAVAWELVPDEDTRRLASVLPDADAREAFLLKMARRVDTERDARTGALAEEHVEGCLKDELTAANRPDLAEQVMRVSKVSDQLGYDVVAPRLVGNKRRLEVKGSRGQGPGFTFSLSRSEARQASQDPNNWRLVACRVGVDDSVEVLGYLLGTDIEPWLPIDPAQGGRWQSVEIVVDEETLYPGLPQ